MVKVRVGVRVRVRVRVRVSVVRRSLRGLELPFLSALCATCFVYRGASLLA